MSQYYSTEYNLFISDILRNNLTTVINCQMWQWDEF